MTSKPRIIISNHFYQISSQCLPELNIFQNIQMKSFFLKQLSISLQKYSFECLAWSLMDDHYHLVIKSSDKSLSLFMQRFNSIIAKQFNKISHRKGAVFAKRYSSIVIQKGKSLSDIIRHIHLNPVRRGDCTLENIDHYEWTGHRSIVNNTPDNITNTEEVLSLFGDSLDRYKTFIRTGTEDPDIINLMRASNGGTLNFHNSNCFVIGDEDFTGIVLEEDRCRKARLARYIGENMTLDKMLQKVRIGVDFAPEDIFRQGRHNEISTARLLFATIGHCDYEFTCTKIAKHLRITTSAVSKMVSRSKRISGLDYLKELICS